MSKVIKNVFEMAAPEKERIVRVATFAGNKNAMSYWLPKFAGIGFRMPDTVIIPLTDEWLTWCMSDQYHPDKIQEFTDWINERLKETGFNTNRELFVKTGNFSNKFVFSFPYLKNTEKIGEQYLNVFYGGMVVGCPICPEICIREFIRTDYERATIYEGMKLNTEFRVFYDFDKKKILGNFNYWNRETMLKNLYVEKEREVFEEAADDIEADFARLQPKLSEMAEQKLKNVELAGIWSIDFLWDGKEFWLIDAALGSDSYYREKIKI